jgi:hypothetical protein
MNRKRYTAIVLLSAVFLGLVSGVMVNTDIVQNKLTQDKVHKHALFFVNANGTDLDLTADRFQLQSKDVHLENNRSNIVHKHAKDVTWGDFLDTVNMTIERQQNQSCLKMPQNQYCGNMTVMLNGEEFDRDKEIEQGDKLAIVTGNNTQQKAENYMEFTLPRAYQKTQPGTRV